MRLKALHVERECKLKLVRKIMDELTNWNPGYGTVAFDTCMAFFDRTYNGTMKGGVEYDKSFLVADIIGFWLAWEVLDHAADTDEERHLARVLGVVIVRHFSNWWTQAA
jgi:hypothetical protein